MGDTLTITTALSALQSTRGVNGIVFSKQPDLFKNNPMVRFHIDYSKMRSYSRSLLKSFVKYMRGPNVICVGTEKWVLGTNPRTNYIVPRGTTWLLDTAPDLRLHNISDADKYTPVIEFSSEELSAYRLKFKNFTEEAVGIIKATAGVNRGNGMGLKNWYIDRWNAVLARIKLPIKFLQIGEADEPLLDHVIDMLGLTIRESFYLMSISRLTVCTEGIVSHAAAAFEAPIICILAGDKEDTLRLGYHKTTFIQADPMPPCSPCFAQTCSTPGKPCTSNITVDQVVNCINETYQKSYGR